MLRLILTAIFLGMLALALGACDSEDSNPLDELGTGTVTLPDQAGIDREAILDDLDEVRALLAAASSLPAELLEQVNYDDGLLTVTATDEIGDRAEALCSDLVDAIESTDLRVVIESLDGTELANCDFDAAS